MHHAKRIDQQSHLHQKGEQNMLVHSTGGVLGKHAVRNPAVLMVDE